MDGSSSSDIDGDLSLGSSDSVIHSADHHRSQSSSSSDESIIIGSHSREYFRSARRFTADLSQPGPSGVLTLPVETPTSVERAADDGQPSARVAARASGSPASGGVTHAAVSSDGAGDSGGVCLEDGVVGRAGRKRKAPYDQGSRARARLRGQSFASKNRNVHHAKIMRPNPCLGGKHKCAGITDQVRMATFQQFYSAASVAEQRSMLAQSISIVPKSRGQGNRVTVAYTIPKENGERQPVCREFLMATLDITAEQVRTVIRNAKSQPKVRRRAPNTVNPERLEAARAWIGALPAVPSHYCRADSTRRYLPSHIGSVNNLFRIYRAEVPDPLRFGMFRKVFKADFNIGIHQPRKDKCVMCTQHVRGERTADEISEHLAEKQALSDLFTTAQQRRDEHERVASFDLQKVLNTPHTDSMLVGYSRRYSVYNETVYESQTRRGLCFIWGEIDGKRGANEITTVVWHYLQRVDQEGNVTNVSLFCDSCSGQNRNRILISALPVMLANMQNIKMIRVTFLLPGHTSMPVDSVHGTIERFVRKRAVWAPSEWPGFLRAARINPFPYEVIKMEHGDFLDWSSSKLFETNKNEDGERVPWGSIRLIQVTPTGVQYATSVQEEGEDGIRLHTVVPQRSSRRGRRPAADHSVPGKAYPAPLAISPVKHRDLMALVNKGIIPREHHQEYMAMRHLDTVPDELDE